MTGNGIIYGVSVGAGEPELITLKAVRILRECDIIAIPASDREKCFAYSVAVKAVPEIKDKPLLCIHMTMTKNTAERECAYKDGAAKLKEAADKGKTVAFITIGDVCVYSTYLYLHEKLMQMGCTSRLISGVTSFCAAAAALSVPLCRDNEELHIIPASGNIERSLEYSGCNVYMKGSIPEIKSKLVGRKVYGAYKCGTDEQVLYGNTDDIPDDAGYFTLIIAKEND